MSGELGYDVSTFACLGFQRLSPSTLRRLSLHEGANRFNGGRDGRFHGLRGWVGMKAMKACNVLG